MKTKTHEAGWSPYLAGALMGLLALFLFFAAAIALARVVYRGTSP